MRILTRLSACLLAFATGTTLCALPMPPDTPVDSPVLGWHVVLRSGFDLTCARMDAQGQKVRLYLHPGSEDFVDINSADIATTEQVELPVEVPVKPTPATVAAATATDESPLDIGSLTAAAGSWVNLDADLIASIIHAESAGNPHAISRAGARGLMQLMPGTAGQLGVSDAFDPKQNIVGGAAYISALLMHYQRRCAGSEQCDLELALAAYNAGPGAVDKYHGIPPYRETRAYVARVIREFNRRKQLARRAPSSNFMMASAATK